MKRGVGMVDTFRNGKQASCAHAPIGEPSRGHRTASKPWRRRLLVGVSAGAATLAVAALAPGWYAAAQAAPRLQTPVARTIPASLVRAIHAQLRNGSVGMGVAPSRQRSRAGSRAPEQPAQVGPTAILKIGGFAVSISADGTTALVGAPGYHTDRGAAYIFHVSSAGAWTGTIPPTAILTDGKGDAGDELGSSVAISCDGRTALIGAPDANGGQGAVYVFHVGSEGSWTSRSKPVATLTDAGGAADSYFGSSVATSVQAKVALIGADGVNSATGAAYVFTAPSGHAWTSSSTPVATLTNSGGAAGDRSGQSVAISGDGSTALVGATGAFPDGAAYVFHVGTASSWTSTGTPTATLSVFECCDAIGSGVALSFKGTTALVGAPNADVDRGEALVFHVYTESSWKSTTTPTAVLTNGSALRGDHLGTSVALSSSGATALVGAAGVSRGTGASYVFEAPSATSWTSTSTPSEMLQLSEGEAQQGSSVSLSASGSTALVGGPGLGQTMVYGVSS